MDSTSRVGMIWTTPPIRMASRIVTAVNVVVPAAKRVAHPTSKLAAPPEPLNSATISGMLVMATRRAEVAPMMVPTTTPTIIH